MNLMHVELARAQTCARLREAQRWRAGDNLVRARRLSRKAERAAERAHLAVARGL